MRLSVIIPCYNEEQRLPRTLESARAWLERRFPDDFEMLLVDDGSTDATPDIAAEAARAHPAIRLIRQPENRGKGAAVRRGMLEALGKTRLFMDADHSTHVREVAKALPLIEAGGTDIVIASRQHPDSEIPVRQSWLREHMGKSFNLLMRLTVGIPMRDTQCGFKAFSAKACEAIFPLQRIEGFGFDVELLYLARLKGLTVTEIPVRWANDDLSRVRMLMDPVRMFADLVRIRRLHRRD